MSTPSPTSSGSKNGSAPAPPACSPRCGRGQSHEGRRPLGRRRRRALPARRHRCRRAGRGHRDRQCRRRHRRARAARLTRPRQHPVRARGHLGRGAGLGAGGRILERARDRRRPRRGVVVSARRSRHRAPSACGRSSSARGSGSPRSAAGSRPRSASAARCCPRPTTRCARSSRPRPARSPSRSGSSPAATATRSTPCTTPARTRRAPAPGVLEAIEAADAIVIAPSNPYVSIGPIVAVDEIRAALEARRAPCIAVSPLIGGRAVKGPADRMLARLAGGTGPAAVAGCYSGLIDALVIDEADAPAELPGVRDRGREDADGRRRRSSPARSRRTRRRGRGRVRIAILGGTGSFGRALAARLVELRRGRGGDRLARRSPRGGDRDRARGGGEWRDERRRRPRRRSRRSRRSRPRRRSRRPAPSRRRSDRRRFFRLRAPSASRRAGSAPTPTRARSPSGSRICVAGPVVAGLHSIAAANLDQAPPEEDALVCGDDADAKALALALAGKVVAGRALDAGPLASARTLEGLTAVIVNLNRRYKAHAGVASPGIPDP